MDEQRADRRSGRRHAPMRRQAFEAAWPDRLLFVIHNWAGKPLFNQASDWSVAPRARWARPSTAPA
jgi:predicted double-glycine peptidase